MKITEDVLKDLGFKYNNDTYKWWEYKSNTYGGDFSFGLEKKRRRVGCDF